MICKSQQEGLYTVLVPNTRCNLKCNYCNTDVSPFLQKIDTMENKNITTTLESMRNVIDTKILKIVGGGEIFLDRNFEEWLLKEGPNYTTIFILTNGVDVSEERLKRLSRLDNIHFGLSLDGHTYEMNQHRFSQKKLFDNAMKTLDWMGKSGAPIQVNTVMHEKNYKDFFDFLTFLEEKEYKITHHMSPVMEKESSPAYSDLNRNWVSVLEKVIAQYEQFSHILLPKAYYKYIIEYISGNGKRNLRCYLPYFMTQLFSTGEITPCPIVWNTSLGFADELVKKNDHKIFDQKIYKLMNRPVPWLPFCRRCSSSYDVLNLFMNDKITIQELEKIHLFSHPQIISRLQAIKQSLIGSSCMTGEQDG